MSDTKNDPKINPKADPKVEQEPAAAPAAAEPAAQGLSGQQGLVLGKKAFLRAVHGRMVHPEAPYDEFDTSTATKVTFDWWHKIQVDAGKLQRDTDD